MKRRPLWLLPLLAALGGCLTPPAPPAETTAATQAQVEALQADLARIAANSARVNAKWAELWGADNAARIRDDLEKKAAAKVAQAAAESRPVTAEEINGIAVDFAATLKAAADAIDATRKAAADPNLDVAAERAALVLDYVAEISARQRALDRARAALKLAPPKTGN